MTFAEEIIAILSDPPPELTEMMRDVYEAAQGKTQFAYLGRWREVCFNMADFFEHAIDASEDKYGLPHE